MSIRLRAIAAAEHEVAHVVTEDEEAATSRASKATTEIIRTVTGVVAIMR